MRNKFRYYFILGVITFFIFSCSSSSSSEALRDYSSQHTADIDIIENYLKNYYITVTNNPGSSDDQNVVFTKIPSGGSQPSVWSYLNKATFPKLLLRPVNFHGITYKLYYLVLREGTGGTEEGGGAPTNVDGVLTSYKGSYLATATDGVATTQFEELKFPQTFFNLATTIVGWAEIFPQFKVGDATAGADGTVVHTDFGAGVMFIPSGLGYYSKSTTSTSTVSIPSYSPLVFSFKLYGVQRLDNDNDGILSYLEDLDDDNYLRDFRNTVNYPSPPSSNPDDTDGDGIPDYLDVDDDGDTYSTKLERSYKDANGITQYYDFSSLPDCSGNTTNVDRVRKYLDKSCH